MRRATLLATAMLTVAPLANAQNSFVTREATISPNIRTAGTGGRDADIRSAPITRAGFQS